MKKYSLFVFLLLLGLVLLVSAAKIAQKCRRETHGFVKFVVIPTDSPILEVNGDAILRPLGRLEHVLRYFCRV